MKSFKRLTDNAVIKLVNKINVLLNGSNYIIVEKKKLSEQQNFTSCLIGVLGPYEESGITSIVFSKDRAMQLHAFLLSYVQKVANRGRVYILYTYSNAEHKKSYEELKAIFKGEDFVFVEENRFRDQFIETCEGCGTGKIMLYVDDMIFTHAIDYYDIADIDTSKNVLTLSRGKDLNYSVVLNRPLTPPQLSKLKNNLYTFSWNSHKGLDDWTFPLGVSGYMYGRVELVAMLKAVTFKAPNSLESALQVFEPYFKNRNGICTDYAACICVQANIAQTEGISNVLGTYSIEELLKQWQAGKRINLDEFYGKPMSETQVLKYSFIAANPAI